MWSARAALLISHGQPTPSAQTTISSAPIAAPSCFTKSRCDPACCRFRRGCLPTPRFRPLKLKCLMNGASTGAPLMPAADAIFETEHLTLRSPMPVDVSTLLKVRGRPLCWGERTVRFQENKANSSHSHSFGDNSFAPNCSRSERQAIRQITDISSVPSS